MSLVTNNKLYIFALESILSQKLQFLNDYIHLSNRVIELISYLMANVPQMIKLILDAINFLRNMVETTHECL